MDCFFEVNREFNTEAMGGKISRQAFRNFVGGFLQNLKGTPSESIKRQLEAEIERLSPKLPKEVRRELLVHLAIYLYKDSKLDDSDTVTEIVRAFHKVLLPTDKIIAPIEEVAKIMASAEQYVFNGGRRGHSDKRYWQ